MQQEQFLQMLQKCAMLMQIALREQHMQKQINKTTPPHDTIGGVVVADGILHCTDDWLSNIKI